MEKSNKSIKLKTTVTWSFLLGFTLTLVGTYLKIIHVDEAETVLFPGLIATLIFIISAVYEVRTSKRIDHAEKTMWTIAFIFMTSIAGFIYFFLGRRRIASNH